MKRWLDRLLGRGAKEEAVLRDVDRERVRFLMTVREGVPTVDWGMAAAWLEKETVDEVERTHLHRAVAAAWLDEVRDSLEGDYRRWRHARVEGLGSMERRIAQDAAEGADRSIRVIEEALGPILGGEKIKPVAVVALESAESYLTFIAPYYPDEGEFATSGGQYNAAFEGSFPFITLPVIGEYESAGVIAHEMTHHALAEFGLPLWVEEGLTQMMEERVTGQLMFRFDEEMVERHQARWEESGLEDFWTGASFLSPHEDEQELSYHLSQLLVRAQLQRDPARFFLFARDCRLKGSEVACAEHLGNDLDAVVWGNLGG
jgi:hypothetical protein